MHLAIAGMLVKNGNPGVKKKVRRGFRAQEVRQTVVTLVGSVGLKWMLSMWSLAAERALLLSAGRRERPDLWQRDGSGRGGYH